MLRRKILLGGLFSIKNYVISGAKPARFRGLKIGPIKAPEFYAGAFMQVGGGGDVFPPSSAVDLGTLLKFRGFSL